MSLIDAIRFAGCIHLAIIAANVPLPGKLKTKEHLRAVPRFIRQIFYVHWIYIVLVLGLFSVLCLGFPSELAGGSRLGAFLSAFLAAFWLLRVVLQWTYYDREVRRANRVLDAAYGLALLVLVVIFSAAALAGGGYGIRLG
ncbi:MAG TPA: hypothetical protein VJQ82_15565 [Terriglobales bacterium]|nr:hypothetical protein [Terriglobales bacterium]